MYSLLFFNYNLNSEPFLSHLFILEIANLSVTSQRVKKPLAKFQLAVQPDPDSNPEEKFCKSSIEMFNLSRRHEKR